MRARARTWVWVDLGFRACVDSRCGVCFLFSTELVNRAGSFLCLFWLLGLLLPCSCSGLFSERCAYFPGMWSSTTTVHCQANTSYAARGACGHLQLQYFVKQIHLMQRGVHVDTYNYSMLSSKYTLCSAGACGHQQLQNVVKQIHLMQLGCMSTPTTTVRCQANAPHAAWVHVDTYNYSTVSSKYTLCSAGCMWSPTTTVCCQANTTRAALMHVDTYNYRRLSSIYTSCSSGACGHLQLQYVVKQIHLMQCGVHVDTNYSTLSSKYILCSAGACGHLQLQYVVKQIHLMQRWCMWTPTPTVRCQANTSYAARVHVDTYNYSTLSSKFTLCSVVCMWTPTTYSTLSSKYSLCSAECMWTPTTTVHCQANTPYAVRGACGHLQLQ